MQQQDVLERDSAINAALSLVVAVFQIVLGFVSVKLILEKVSVAEYGDYLLFLATAAVLQLSYIWILPGVLRHVTEELHITGRYGRTFGTALFFLALLSVPLGLAVWWGQGSSVSWLHGLRIAPWSLAGVVAGTALLDICRQTLNARGYFRFALGMVMSARVLYTGMLVLFFYGETEGGVTTVASYLAATTLAPGLVCLGAVLRGCRAQVDATVLRQMAREYLPLFGANVCDRGIRHVDEFVIAAFLGRTQLGIYGLAYLVMFQLSVLGSMIQGVIQPIYQKWVARDNRGAEALFVNAILPHLLLAGALLLALLIPFAKWIMLLLGMTYTDAGELLRLLILGVFFWYVHLSLSLPLVCRGVTLPTALLFALAFVVNLAADLLLIREIGAWGPAVATVAILAMISLGEHLIVWRRLGLEGMWKAWMPFFPLLAVWGTYEFFPGLMAMPTAISGVIIGILALRQSDVFAADAGPAALKLRIGDGLKIQLLAYLNWMRHLHHVNEFSEYEYDYSDADGEWDDDDEVDFAEDAYEPVAPDRRFATGAPPRD